jgi:hypothetical protein
LLCARNLGSQISPAWCEKINDAMKKITAPAGRLATLILMLNKYQPLEQDSEWNEN